MRIRKLAAMAALLVIATAAEAKPKPPVTLTVHGRSSDVLANLARELFAGGCVVTSTSSMLIAGKRSSYTYSFVVTAADSVTTTIAGRCFVDGLRAEWPLVDQTGNGHQRDELYGFIARAAVPDTAVATTPRP